MRHGNLFARAIGLLAGGMLLMTTLYTDAEEPQITHDSTYNHELDNNDNFSPDDRFLVFDTRPGPDLSQARVIAKVEIATGEITKLYAPAHPNAFGPGVLAASYAPDRDEVIFIHGPLHPTGPEDQYEKHRRIGGMVSGDGGGTVRFADARDTQSPYTPVRCGAGRTVMNSPAMESGLASHTTMR